MRILKHYVDLAREKIDLSDMNVMGIYEFSVQKYHVYVTLFYDIENSRVVDIEEGKEPDAFSRFRMKHSFLGPHIIDHITMYAYTTYTYDPKGHFPNSRIVFDHFHVIKMMNDTLGRIRRKESRINAILKHTEYKWLKNYSDLKEKESDRLLSIEKSDLQTAHAYHFKITLQRLWQVNVPIAEDYLRKLTAQASRSRMHEIIKLGKTMKKHPDGILETIRSGINSAVIEALNNKIRTAFNRSFGFKSLENRGTIIYLVAGELKLPTII